MTAYGEVELAVEALKLGASDFILKPWNNEKLYASVNLAVDVSLQEQKAASVGKYSANRSELYSGKVIQGLYKNILHTLDKIAPTDANVLLLGENGTGKYVLAEQIHRKSPRNKEPFVHIDLGSLPEGAF